MTKKVDQWDSKVPVTETVRVPRLLLRIRKTNIKI